MELLYSVLILLDYYVLMTETCQNEYHSSNEPEKDGKSIFGSLKLFVCACNWLIWLWFVFCICSISTLNASFVKIKSWNCETIWKYVFSYSILDCSWIVLKSAKSSNKYLWLNIVELWPHCFYFLFPFSQLGNRHCPYVARCKFVLLCFCVRPLRIFNSLSLFESIVNKKMQNLA